ncbi:uncharacterized protein LOC113218935, partial [Apis mellifera]|uniref:Uncharacterized protein LOC113218935 n=1 Tax=Apis mellifera TaxID=7460 RepID=A0A7M7MME0_APIME
NPLCRRFFAQLEIILTDLSAKFPCLKYILRPQYAPYLNTAGTVLLGWLIVSWISYIVWMLLAPVAISIIAIILICPTTAKWCMKQMVPNIEESFNQMLEKFQVFLSQIRQ